MGYEGKTTGSPPAPESPRGRRDHPYIDLLSSVRQNLPKISWSRLSFPGPITNRPMKTNIASIACEAPLKPSPWPTCISVAISIVNASASAAGRASIPDDEDNDLRIDQVFMLFVHTAFSVRSPGDT